MTGLPARPAAAAGGGRATVGLSSPRVHRASVRFAQAGTWRHVVGDGFTMRHTDPAVRIAADGPRISPRQAQDYGTRMSAGVLRS